MGRWPIQPTSTRLLVAQKRERDMPTECHGFQAMRRKLPEAGPATVGAARTDGSPRTVQMELE
jgi:hypothetical protein